MKWLHRFLILIISSELDSQKVIPLYDGVAKGSENWTWSENTFQTDIVYNVTHPTITAYLPPKEAANGTAIIIAPGGAFHILSMKNEGVDVARWLNSKGIAAFVLKYRLSQIKSDDPISELMGKMTDFKKLDSINASTIPLAMTDGLTAMKYIRDHAKEMNIDPKKIGFMGFSAGGTLTMSVVYNGDESNRPNFVAPIYAYEPAIIGSKVPNTKTPIFITVAGDDQLGMMPMSINIYRKWFDAKQPSELHIYESGGHGFGMRKQNIPTDTWYDRFGDWLKQHGYMNPIVSTNMFQRIPSPNDTLKSVRHLSDGKLQFSIYAPEAKSVTISGDFPGGFPALSLHKDFSGVWSITTNGPAKPNVYTYDFMVDGLKVFDPKNAEYKESNTGFSNIVEIKGAENDYQSLQNVPHGKIEKVYYISTALNGITRRLHIYFPPGYDQQKIKTKLPVLYLLHGGGDNDASWTTVGKANLILDNLYAQGKLKPMLVVMPAGHTPVQGFFMGAGDKQDPFCRDFIQDIIPFVEKNYPVSTKREYRAISGLSMGGIQAINLALWNPDLFGYVFPMSTGYFPDAIKEIDEKHIAVLKNPSVNQFKKFMIAIGKDDFANTNNKNMMELFKKHGVKFEYYETEGAHTFLFWRRHLGYFSPMLFR